MPEPNGKPQAIQDPALKESIARSRVFVALVKRGEELPRRTFLQQLKPILQDLLRLVPDRSLGSAESADDEDGVEPFSSSMHFNDMARFQRILATPSLEPWLPNEEGFGTHVDPWELGDAIAYIWRAIRTGLALWDRADPGAREQAAWQFHFEFNHHCNHHAQEILQGIEFLCANAGDSP